VLAGVRQKAIDLLRQKGIARAAKRSDRGASEGVIGSYVHFNGKVAVLVELNCETDFVARTEDFQRLAKDLSLHIASANPLAVSEETVPADVLDREKAIYRAQAAESGKPAAVQEKMVDGKVRKFLEERVLLEQPFDGLTPRTASELLEFVRGGETSEGGRRTVVITAQDIPAVIHRRVERVYRVTRAGTLVAEPAG